MSKPCLSGDNHIFMKLFGNILGFILGLLVFVVVILAIMYGLYGLYLLYRRLRGTRKINQEKIIEQWTTLIEGANGEGEKVLKGAIRIIERLNPPDVFATRKEIRPGPGLIKTRREFLVVEHKLLDVYDMYVGARDYGKQLFVSWYLVAEPMSFFRMFKRAPIKTLFVYPFVVAARIFLSYKGLDTKLMRGLNLFDTEEMTAYVTTVHHAVTEATKEMAEGNNIDFTKINTKTRGFLNLS